MVGVPHTSKGCHTCVQRKTKCDGAGVPCGNCRRSQRQCGGYKKMPIFVSARVAAAGRETDAQSSSSGETATCRRVSEGNVSGRRSSAKARSTIPLIRAASDIPMVKSVSPASALRGGLLDVFLRQYMPNEVLEAHEPDIKSRNWLLYLPDVAEHTPALNFSVTAICAARLGRERRDRALVLHSLQLYTRGLGELSRALQSSLARITDETLAACMALAMYEMSECPAGMTDGYISHQNGAMMLLQARGPKAHSSGLGRVLFLSLRLQVIFQSFGSRRGTFLSRPEWLSDPWRNYERSPYDRLLDELVRIADLFRQSGTLHTEQSADLLRQRLADLVKSCWSIDARLQRWHSDFEAKLAGPVYWPQLPKLTTPTDTADPEKGAVFPVAFYFPSVDVAQSMALYWAAQVMVHSHLATMMRKLASMEAESGGGEKRSPELPLPEPRHDWCHTSVRYICQSAEYFMQDQMGFMCTFFIVPLLVMTRACILGTRADGMAREVSWMGDIFSITR